MQEIILKFNPEFQKEIFQKVVDKYKNSINASKYLNIPASSIRGYKNLYFNYVPEKLINKIIKLGIIKSKEVRRKILSSVDKIEITDNNLHIGRMKRKQNLIELKKSIPGVEKIITNNKINIYEWFRYYKKLLDSGFRKTSYQIKDAYVIIKYDNYNRKSMKSFKVTLPKEIVIDDEFSYFFGLWCGDRAGGKRLGICNQNKEILDFVEFFLKKYNQKIEKILYISPSIKSPKVYYDKVYYTRDDTRGWCLSTHSQNGIFSSFFYYLQENLRGFLKLAKKDAFFAGLFDAEGNVSLYNKSFRWACKNEELVKIYKKTLENEGFKNKYDGASIVCYDKNLFLKRIYPYLKHSGKINKTMLLCNIGGNLLDKHIEILKYLKKFPNSNQKQIAKALKKNKVYSELRILNELNFISKKGYPPKFGIINKGFKSLGE